MVRNEAPFRADQVGSLLRPQSVRTARKEFAEGKIGASDLKAVEDEAIVRLIERQEAIGLKGVTDGELRREGWAIDFFRGLQGVRVEHEEAVNFQGMAGHRAAMAKVKEPLDFADHPMIEHFKFVRDHTRATAKMTAPSPTMLASPARDWRNAVDRDIYPGLPDLFRDLAEVYRKAIKAFGDAGCRYLQLDDCALAFVCDQNVRRRIEERGDDPNEMIEEWVQLVNSALEAKPDGMVISTHVCRGNFRSTWLAQGGYEPVADALLNRINFDAYFLEYDSDRAGGFEPLSRLPKTGDKVVVLGLITTKTGALENKDEIKRRIDQATKYVDLDRLCLSPQCGFSSSEEGNNLSEDEQWAKLAEVVEIAGEVWGAA